MVWRSGRRSVFGAHYSEFTIDNLMAGQLAQMVARGLAPITAAGFLTQLNENVVNDVYRHIQVPRLRVVGKEHENGEIEPVAFLASQLLTASLYHNNDVALYHLGGVIIGEKGCGMGKRLLTDELELTSATHLGFHTQNAHMLRLGERVSRYDYSCSSAFAHDMNTTHFTTEVVDDRPMIVDQGRYGGASLYGDMRTFKKMGMQIPGLHTQNGDAVVYVGRVI